MSWNVVLIRTKKNKEEYEKIQDEEIIPFTKAEVVNTMMEISKILGACVKDIDSEIVHMYGNGWAIAFYFFDAEPYETITVEIRGNTEPKEAVQLIEERLNARIFDLYLGQFIDQQIPSGFKQWKNHCEKIGRELTMKKKL